MRILQSEFSCKEKKLLKIRVVRFSGLGSMKSRIYSMDRNSIKPSVIHLLLTLIISAGFVKTSEFIHTHTLPETSKSFDSYNATIFGNLPCGNNRG